jgi:hypothetical protein
MHTMRFAPNRAPPHGKIPPEIGFFTRDLAGLVSFEFNSIMIFPN